MNWINNLKIGSKVILVAAVLIVACTAIGGVAMQTIFRSEQLLGDMENSANRSILGEHANGLINAVVMDSRGIYMAKSTAEAEKFAPPLLTNLTRIEAQFTRWAGLLPAARLAELGEARR